MSVKDEILKKLGEKRKKKTDSLMKLVEFNKEDIDKEVREVFFRILNGDGSGSDVIETVSLLVSNKFSDNVDKLTADKENLVFNFVEDRVNEFVKDLARK